MGRDNAHGRRAGTPRVADDYAGAWSAVRRRCHRMVYGDGGGHPEDCPGMPAMTGWRADGRGRSPPSPTKRWADRWDLSQASQDGSSVWKVVSPVAMPSL